MRKLLFSIITIIGFTQIALAQPATVSVPLSIGRNNCGGGGGLFRPANDSLYYFSYTSPNLTNHIPMPQGCQPILNPKPRGQNFMVYDASIAFNPADQLIYYVWTNYSVPAPYKSYIWRWAPNTCPRPAGGYDTLRTFNTDIGGITFDANGIGWQLEFSASAPYQARLRKVDFSLGTVGIPDTLDLTGGKQLWNVGTGDITLTPSGQMYFVFDNKLFTPDYGSAGGPTGHIKCTYIDTIRRPAGASGLPGLAFGDGDLIASFSPGCRYGKIDPVTGDTGIVTYSGYIAGKGVASYDLAAISSGVGAAKKLISVTPTGTPGQYDVIYDIYTRNYGNVPLTNVQLTDDLKTINGVTNVSNVSATLTSNPAGVALNPLYNGTTNINLLAASQSLPCYPVSDNNFTIRISCRLSNILSGVIYNNSAIATANGFNNAALRDSSTNGSTPDLNQNDKPDDVGEGQPTPFVILITPSTAPCEVIHQILYNQDFGAGTTMLNNIPASVAVPSASSTYTGSTIAPIGTDRFTVVDIASKGDPSNWISLRDHTGNTNGRMLLVNANAAARTMYVDTLPIACAGQQYSVSLWASFVGNPAYKVICDGLGGFKYPKLLIRVRDLISGLTITQSTTIDIVDTTWQQFGLKFVIPPGYTNLIIEVLNAAPGGCGNDVALDDIQFGICSAAPTVSVSGITGGCIGSVTTFNSELTDSSAIGGTVAYQWQRANSLGGPWTDIPLATSPNYSLTITPADTGKYFRVIVAAAGNIGNPSCQYVSPAIQLTGKAPSVAAASATKNKNNICPGISVSLGITGGTLGTNASWKWYAGSCSGSSIGTGSTINVTPSVTTTYYVRAEGDCNTTTCQAVTVFISCDIDKDKDGIPDWVESNMTAAFADANANGIINAYDPTYPGFVDNNNDYINDNFQADGDSDNDGIPNYLDTGFPGRVDSNADGVDDRFDTDLDGIINMLDLDSDNDGIPDVVEAYGVDTDGDGKIDNYSDADGDGLSDQVDNNLTNAYNSGLGLGIPNFDNDAVPNFLDLDSDNDGIPDVVEADGPDTNNDGKIDGFVDVNGDGLHDGYINATALLRTGADVSADGKADSYPNKNKDRDFRPNAYDLDSDGDGIADVIEAGFPDVDFNGIVDGAIGSNGWAIVISSKPTLGLRFTDADSYPDYLDIDSDADGIPDNIEGQTTAGYILPTLTDTDGDGIVNVYDNNPSAFGGSGILVYDHDGDGIPDYRDLDTDGDGQPDIAEGNDFNLNNIADDNITPTGLDTDGDGLDNRFDSLNSVTNIKGTSYMMGNGGSLTGDPAPGARCTVQKKTIGQPNRDWRYVGVVLPVEILSFTATQQNKIVTLNWKIIANKEIDRFEVERSPDNSSFMKVATVTDPVTLNVQQSFGATDNIAGISSDVLYYRLKVIGSNGDIKYSNIIAIKNSSIKTDIRVTPNPARNFVQVKLYAQRETDVTFRLIDYMGKVVLMQVNKVYKGDNVIEIIGVNKLSNAVYSLQVLIDDDLETKKLVIAR